jgi:replicative DNA helicase
MSIGLAFLRSCIEHGSRTAFRQARPDLFVGDEVAAYTFVSLHYRQHGQLPAVATCAENGVVLSVTPMEPPSYYLARMSRRAQYNVVSPTLPQFSAAMAERDMEAVHALVAGWNQGFNAFTPGRDVTPLHELSEAVWEDYLLTQQEGASVMIPMGWDFLTESLQGGLEPGDVCTVVGRPGQGKSWLMIHCARHAWMAGASVLFLSMEMTPQQITRRMMGYEASLNPNILRRGNMTQHSQDQIIAAIEQFGPTNRPPFHVMSGSFKASVPAVDAAIQEFQPDIVFIDASYLMRPGAPKARAAAWELVAEVGTEVKEMAMRRTVPVVQSVQFNREATKAKTRGTEHIGGSDVIGQISTVVMGIGPGPSPFERVQRELTLHKVRESEDGVKMRVRFEFDPPRFDYIPPDEEVEAATSTAWEA